MPGSKMDRTRDVSPPPTSEAATTANKTHDTSTPPRFFPAPGSTRGRTPSPRRQNLPPSSLRKVQSATALSTQGSESQTDSDKSEYFGVSVPQLYTVENRIYDHWLSETETSPTHPIFPRPKQEVAIQVFADYQTSEKISSVEFLTFDLATLTFASLKAYIRYVFIESSLYADGGNINGKGRQDAIEKGLTKVGEVIVAQLDSQQTEFTFRARVHDGNVVAAMMMIGQRAFDYRLVVKFIGEEVEQERGGRDADVKEDAGEGRVTAEKRESESVRRSGEDGGDKVDSEQKEDVEDHGNGDDEKAFL